MNKVFLFVIFASILVFPSLTYADGPYLNIPPTNAFDKIHTDNGTVHAANFSMPLTIQGDSSISVQSNNQTHTVKISAKGSGLNCTGTEVDNQTASRSFNTSYHNTSGKPIFVFVVINMNPAVDTSFEHDAFIDTKPINSTLIQAISITSLELHTGFGSITTSQWLVPPGYYYELDDVPNAQIIESIVTWYEILNPSCSTGGYKATTANNVIINSGGNRTNYINGTGNPIHVVNDPTRNQVNVTISSTGGITSLNSQNGPAVNIVGQTGNITITNSTNLIKINTGQNIANLASTQNQTFSGKVNFTATSKLAGLNIGGFSSTPTNIKTADIWYNTAGNQFMADINNFVRTFAFKEGTNIWTGANTETDTLFKISNIPSQTSKAIGWLLSGMTSNTVLTIRSNQTTSQGANIPNLVSTDTFMMQVAQNQTSDANAISNLPILNHHCAFYFVTGNSTFRNICNFNGVVHVLSKG